MRRSRAVAGDFAWLQSFELGAGLQRQHDGPSRPLRERMVKLSMRHYDSMVVGAFDLLQHKRGEAEAYRAYLRELRDYWISRSELTRAVGGQLPKAR